ncbi:MAG: hypothetical protein RJB39_165 [Candidatus Parcubacteria bacterium]|jgi:adenylate kinase family enzyme
MHQKRLQTIVTSLLLTHGGLACCLAGLEGGGKSTAATALSEACPDLVRVVYVSKALATHCEFLETGPGRHGRATKALIREVRAKMEARDKNIDPQFLKAALHRALMAVIGKEMGEGESPNLFVLIDGYPRLKEQADEAPAVLGGFFPNHPALILEVGCDQEEAFRRATSRGGDWNSPSNITRSHLEFNQRMPDVRSAATRWSDHIMISSDGPQDETLAQLADRLEEYSARIATGGFKKPDPALMIQGILANV